MRTCLRSSKMKFSIFLILIVINGIPCHGAEDDNETKRGMPSDDEIFKTMFKIKRSEQTEAVGRLVFMNDRTKQFKMVQLVLDKIEQLLTPAKLTMENEGYIPGDEFPTTVAAREALAQILENTALFSEILLHLPDITHNLLAKKQQSIFHWSIMFSNDTNLLDIKTTKLLNLAAQELNLIPRNPNYINPYHIIPKEDSMPSSTSESQKQTKKKKKTRTRGPQLTKNTEL